MAFTSPLNNLKELGLGEGMIVADLGAGGGHYSLLAAKQVGGGKVYAIDVQRGLLDKLKNQARDEGLSNIEIIWANLEKEHGSNLKDNSVDALIVSNTLFLVEDKKSFMKEVKRILRPGGKVLFVDWSDSFGGLGPQQENIIREDEARAIFKENNFDLVKNLQDVGDHHYGFVAKLNK
jgi:ubiquinone/menaquinone biosynthesis C-methylase UbiE